MGIAARKAGLHRNGCAAYSIARALGEADEHGEAAEWLPVVVEQLRALREATEDRMGMDGKGSNRNTRKCMEALGLKVLRRISTEPERSTRRVYIPTWDEYDEHRVRYFPTVARFLRENPTIQRALIRTDGHAAFVDRKRGYGAGPRHRVLFAYVLEDERRAATT